MYKIRIDKQLNYLNNVASDDVAINHIIQDVTDNIRTLVEELEFEYDNLNQEKLLETDEKVLYKNCLQQIVKHYCRKEIRIQKHICENCIYYDTTKDVTICHFNQITPKFITQEVKENGVIKTWKTIKNMLFHIPEECQFIVEHVVINKNQLK